MNCVDFSGVKSLGGNASSASLSSSVYFANRNESDFGSELRFFIRTYLTFLLEEVSLMVVRWSGKKRRCKTCL